MRLWLAGLVAVAVLGPPPARADVIYEVTPAVGAGATDNVFVTGAGPQHQGDGFVQASGNVRARYAARLSEHALGYRLMLTRYLQESGLNTVAQALAATSSFNLTARLTLRLAANGELTRTSSLGATADPTTAFPQAAVTGTRPYYSIAASEDLIYAATARTTYGERLSFAQIHYLDDTGDVPTTTLINGALTGRYVTGRDAYTLLVSLGDSITPSAPAAANTFTQGDVFFGQALVGWSHDLSPTWSTMVQAGPAIIFKLSGPAVLAPAGLASISYARLPWFASLSITQTPAPNLFVGATTISDEVMARFALPLTRSEVIYVGAFGGYLFARYATAQADLARAYDQLTGGASLIVRSPRYPFSGALTYLAVSQRGNDAGGSDSIDRPVPSLARQSVMLTIAGTFAWGPGTPPLFGGVL